MLDADGGVEVRASGRERSGVGARRGGCAPAGGAAPGVDGSGVMRKEAEGSGVEEDLGRAFGRNGDVYRWLREHYDFVKRWRAERSPTWGTIAEQMSARGVVGMRGKAPTERSVWKVWQRVCRDVEAARKREEEERGRREAAVERRRAALAGQAIAAPKSGGTVVKTEAGVGGCSLRASADGKPETLRAAEDILKQLSGLEPMQKQW